VRQRVERAGHEEHGQGHAGEEREAAVGPSGDQGALTLGQALTLNSQEAPGFSRRRGLGSPRRWAAIAAHPGWYSRGSTAR